MTHPDEMNDYLRPGTAAGAAATAPEPTSLRLVIEVTAGVLPGVPDLHHSRAYNMSTDEWEKAQEAGLEGSALAELNGQAAGYAALLQLQPDRLNWVRTEWVWL